MSDKVVKLIEDVKALTVLELSELVKALEEEFGVSAAAPVAVAAAPAGAAAAPAAVAAGETAVNSPMPGNIFKVECSVGQSVKAGDVLIVLEAMKMEIEVSAPVDGTVKSVAVNVGATVNTDDLLVTLG